MTTSGGPYVGYEVRVHGGPPHRGITTNPKRCLEEHQERLGPSAFMHILTPPLSAREAKAWERMLAHKQNQALDPASGWGGIAATMPSRRR